MYVIVIGNLVRVIGPFATKAEADAYADRFDIMSENYNPGRWGNYSVSVVPLTKPEGTK